MGFAQELPSPTNDAQVQGPAVGERNFDIQFVSAFDKGLQVATGVSNGVGWAMCRARFEQGFGSSVDDSYTGFGSDAFAPPVANEDSLHITHSDFFLVFEQPVERIVFYSREDLGRANLDLGLEPKVLSGGDNLRITGTQIRANTKGGAFFFEGLNTSILRHRTNVYDGTNIAFYVEALAPSAGPLLGYVESLCNSVFDFWAF